MNRTDNDFFEEYKRLEKLCKDLFSSKEGVNEYINEMKLEEHGEKLVKSWKSDYYSLIHLRHVRNLIAHEYSSDGFSNEADITLLRDFYDRIIRMQDPLSLLNKAKENSQRKQASAAIQNKDKKKLKYRIAFAVSVLFILAGAAVMILSMFPLLLDFFK